MIHEEPCSLWDSLEECWVEVSWSTQGQRSPCRMRGLAQAYWDPSQKHDALLLFAANVTLDAATAHPALLLSEEGKRVTWQKKCQDPKKKKEEEVSRSFQLHTEIQLHSPLCLVNWASAQGDTSGRCRLGTPVPGTWEFVG